MEFDTDTTTSGGLPNNWWVRGCSRCGSDMKHSTAEYCVSCDEYVHPWLPDPLPEPAIPQRPRAMRAQWPNSSAQGVEGFIARVARRLWLKVR